MTSPKRCNKISWNIIKSWAQHLTVIIMPTLSPLLAPEVVCMTTSNATSGDKLGITMTCFSMNASGELILLMWYSWYSSMKEMCIIIRIIQIKFHCDTSLTTYNQKKLEQLERLRSDTPPPMITHTNDWHIRSQIKTRQRQSYKF